MSTATPAAAPRRNLWRLYLTEARLEFLKMLRLPTFSIATLGFPIMFYLLFSSMFGGFSVQGISTARYLVAGYGAAGVLSATMFGFGVGVASERGQGWMRLKRVSPMRPLAYFVAKIVMALVFSTIVVIALTLLAWALQGVRFELGTWLEMYGVLMLGAFPFASLGIAFGYLFGPNSAPVVINILFMLLSFGSGLFIPLTTMPAAVQQIATYLPTYHYGQLTLSAVGAEPLASTGTHVLVLIGSTVLFLGLALWAYFRDEGKTYG